MKFSIEFSKNSSDNSEKNMKEEILRLQDELSKLKVRINSNENSSSKKDMKWAALLVGAFPVLLQESGVLLKDVSTYFYTEIFQNFCKEETISQDVYFQFGIKSALALLCCFVLCWIIKQVLK